MPKGQQSKQNNAWTGAIAIVAQLLVTGLLLVLPKPADAELLGEPYFETVFDEQQRQFGTIVALCQDTDGQLWVGSVYGLVRYDGYRVQRFLHADNDPHSVPSDYIRSLHADADGRVWAGTDADGLAIFDPAEERFENHRHDPRDPHSLINDSVWAIASDARNGVWVGTNAGLDLWRAAVGRFDHYPAGTDTGPGDARIRRLLVDRRGTLWVGTESGLDRRPAGSNRFEPVATAAIAGHAVASLFEAADGKIWVAAPGFGVGWITAESSELSPLPKSAELALQGRPVIAIAQPTPDQIWLRLEVGGMLVVAADDGELRHEIVPDPANPSSLLPGGSKYEALLTDHSGLLWISASGAGLQKHNPGNPAFNVFRHNPTRPESLSINSINTLLATADGRLWIGTDGNGIDIFDRQRGVVDRLRASPDARTGLSDGVIRALAETADGLIWIGTQRAGLYRFDRSDRSLRRYTPADGLPDNFVRRLLPDGQGGVWIGSNLGVAHFDPARGRAQPLTLTDGRPMQERVRVLLLDHGDRLWVGTANGLYLRDPEGRGLRRVGTANGEPGLSQQGILGLHADSDHRLWVSTGNGLDRLSAWVGGEPQFESISSRLGIPGEALGENVLSDAEGRLWTGSELIQPADWRLRRFGRADGVDIGTIWGGAYARSSDGMLWFGGSKGLLSVDPTRYRPWAFQPTVVATTLKLDGVATGLRRLTPRLSLAPSTRGFSIEFAALDFSHPDSNRYAYRLDGYDRDWIATDAGSRVASYSNLWPGQYTLNVRGSNRNGDWSPHQLSIPVTVLPAFWQTPWFAALLVFAVAANGYAGVRWRTARIQRQATVLETLVVQRTAQLVDTQQQLVTQEKMAALGTLTAGVAHEINNPTNFADGAVQNLVEQHQRLHEFLRDLAGSEAEPEVLAAFQKRFDELAEMTGIAREGHERIKGIVRDLRQFTRLDEAEHKPMAIAEPIQSTVNLIRTKYDRVAFELDLTYNPDVECQPAKLSQLFMNLIVNACEAIGECSDGRAGVVRIVTAANDGHVDIRIEDNGAGMSEATRARIFEPFFTTKEVGKGTGLGLAITIGIIKEHGGSIEVTSTLGAGSQMTVRLPLASNAARIKGAPA